MLHQEQSSPSSFHYSLFDRQVGKKAKETADRLNYAESYVETAQDLIDHTAKVIVEANRKFQKDKEEISRDMSDITKDVSDQIILARQNMIQLGRLFEQDRERYEKIIFYHAIECIYCNL